MKIKTIFCLPRFLIISFISLTAVFLGFNYIFSAASFDPADYYPEWCLDTDKNPNPKTVINGNSFDLYVYLRILATITILFREAACRP